jgi:hypothetical protein
VERSRGWIVEWGAHIYRRMAGGHIAVDGYRGENCVVITLRVREKRRMRRIMRVVNDIMRNGHLEHVLEVDFWGWIRVRRVYRGYMGVNGELRVVKGVMIGRLYREGHCNWARRMGERGLCGVSGGGRSEWTGEIVGERPPVKGGGRVNDGSGRGGRHRT